MDLISYLALWLQHFTVGWSRGEHTYFWTNIHFCQVKLTMDGKVMGNVKTVTAKYSHVVFHEVAKIPLPDTVTVVRDQ